MFRMPLFVFAAWALALPLAAQTPKKKSPPKLNLDFLKPPAEKAPEAVGPTLKGQVLDDKSEEPVEFPLGPEHGPALLQVAAYVGKDGSRLANNLARELRQRHGLRAYVWRMQEEGDPRYREMSADEKEAYVKKFLRPPRQFKYQIPPPVNFGVLVGDFTSLTDDRNLDRAKQRLQSLAPGAFSPEVSRELAWSNPQATGGKPQLMRIRPAPNPRRPKSARPDYAPEQIALLRKLNSGGTSIYQNQSSRFTLQLFQFQGTSGIVTEDNARQLLAAKGKEVDGLTLAAENAEKLCLALRKLGFPAGTFHGIKHSAVCLGAYNSAEDPRVADGLERARKLTVLSLPMQPELIELPALFAGALRGN